jgi:hypothetical protein
MDSQTAEAAVKLGLEHFSLSCLAALSTTSKFWHARVQAALDAAAPTVAQRLLLQTAGAVNSNVPPLALLKALIERASSIADGAAVESFATTLATKLVSHPRITWDQARVWLSSGLQLSNAAIYAAARIPSAQPVCWVSCHREMLAHTAGYLPLSPMLQALCLKDHDKVSFAEYRLLWPFQLQSWFGPLKGLRKDMCRCFQCQKHCHSVSLPLKVWA